MAASLSIAQDIDTPDLGGGRLEACYTHDYLNLTSISSLPLAGIAAGLWRSSARKYKEYALNPCCPACGRDLVDCLSEKMFARSKCKAKMEVGADG